MRDEAEEDSESEGGGSTSQLIDDFHSLTLDSFCEPAFQRRVRTEGRKEGRSRNIEALKNLSSLSLSLSLSGHSYLSAAYRDNALHSEVGGVCSTRHAFFGASFKGTVHMQYYHATFVKINVSGV